MQPRKKPRKPSPKSYFDFALEARLALAKFCHGIGGHEEGQKAFELAQACGRLEHPRPQPSPLIAEEPDLVGAWKIGWDQRAYELRPLTQQDLMAKISEIRTEANQGCGQFYELYAQNFTRMVDDWLDTIRPNEREMALELLKGDDYSPNTNGRWEYDQEEGDIHFVEA